MNRTEELRKIAKEAVESIMMDSSGIQHGEESSVEIPTDFLIEGKEFDEILDAIEEALREYDEVFVKFHDVNDLWCDWIKVEYTPKVESVWADTEEWDEEEDDYYLGVRYTLAPKYFCGVSGFDSNEINEKEYNRLLLKVVNN